MKNAKKFDVKMLAIWLITLAAFIAVVFLLPISRNTVFYVAFAMTLVSFGLVAFAYVQSFLHDDTLSSKLLGFPIFRVSLIALALQMAVFAVLAALSTVCPVWLAVIVEGVVLAGTAVCLIATEAARGVIEDAELKLTDKTQMMKKLRILAEAAISQQEDTCVRDEVEKLARVLRYADPVSCEDTQDVERQLEMLIGRLNEGSTESRVANAKEACALAERRNSLVRFSK